MRSFKPTHRIETIKREGVVEHRETFTVMLVEHGTAFTEAEWTRYGMFHEPYPQWRFVDGEWRYWGDVGAFDEVRVEPLVPDWQPPRVTASDANAVARLHVQPIALTVEEMARFRERAGANRRTLNEQVAALVRAFAVEVLPFSGKNRLMALLNEYVHWTIEARDNDDAFAEKRAASKWGKIVEQVDAVTQDPARKLARAILDRSLSEDECNTIEDAVALAKLVLGEKM